MGEARSRRQRRKEGKGRESKGHEHRRLHGLALELQTVHPSSALPNQPPAKALASLSRQSPETGWG